MSSRNVCIVLFATICALGTASCDNSPGSFGSRLTETGRLLADGPPARMTASAIAESQADAVPLLYTFALEAGQIAAPSPASGAFPATDPTAQQIALLDKGINWPATTLVGEAYIDQQCDRFLGALNELERSKRATLADLNAVQSATVGIMGLALAAQKSIGIVGVAFGLTSGLIDNTTSAVLYQLPASSIRPIVMAQRDLLRQSEAPPDSVVAAITNQGMATARLNEYIQYCVPVTIEANVANVLSNSSGKDGKIVTGAANPAVTSVVVPIQPPDPKVGVIVAQSVQARLVAFGGFMRTVTDQQVLQAAAKALAIPQATTNPATEQAFIIATVSNLVRGGDAASAGSRMDAVVHTLEPILHRTF